MNMPSARTVTTTAILGLALLSLPPLAAHARGGRGGHGPSPERAAARLAHKLDLNDAQQQKVEAILAESFAARRELREQHRDAMDTLRDSTDDQLAGVLTEEQVDDLQELREARRERRRDCGRDGDRWHDGPGDE